MSFRRHLLKRMKGEKELPYIQLDYIESTGTQYIDTGYIPTINTDIKTRASVQYNSGSTPVALFGYLSGNDPYNRYAVQYHKDIIYCAKGKTEATNDTIDYTKMCDIETQGDKYIYNGIEMSVEPLDFSVSNKLSIVLFARRTTNVNRHSKSKIEFFKIYENSTLVMDLIPCIRKSDGVVCMYDNVSKSFFENEGTGSFIPGTLTNLPEGYAQVSYLESTGTQYIDTGITTDLVNDVKWKLKTAITKYTSNSLFMGANGNAVLGYTQTSIGVPSGMTNYVIGDAVELIVHKNMSNERYLYYLNEIYKGSNASKSGRNIFLFSNDVDGTGAYKIYCRIYYSKIYINDELVRNMIPCIDATGTPCMYDTVSGQTFYNQGTGDFIYGEIIKRTGFPKGYQQLEYLQAIDGNYIFIPVTVKSTDVFKMKVKPLANDASFVMGITYNGHTSGVQLRYQSGAWQGRWGSNAWLNYKTAPINEIYEIVYKNGEIIINGETIPFTKATSNIEGTGNLGIFARQYNNKPELNTGEMQIMSFQMNDDINLVPALDENGRPCMYDMVNYKTYYNLGEGEFLYGIKEPTKNLIKETNLGFPAGDSTSISINSTYPYSYYMNDILLEEGKTYEINITYVREPKSTDDGTVRFRMLNEDGTFWGAPASGTYTSFFESVELIGKVGTTAIHRWFSFQKAILKPKKNCYMRPLVILGTKTKTPPCAYFVDIKEV